MILPYLRAHRTAPESPSKVVAISCELIRRQLFNSLRSCQIKRERGTIITPGGHRLRIRGADYNRGT